MHWTMEETLVTETEERKFQTASINHFIKGEFMRKGQQKCQTGTDTRGKGNA